MAQHLLLAADRYQLIRLRTMCEKRLCDSVDVETVATTLMLADKSNADNLRKVRLPFSAYSCIIIVQRVHYRPMWRQAQSIKAQLWCISCDTYLMISIRQE